MKREFKGNLMALDLRQTYHEIGDYSFKVVLNPFMFKNSLTCDMRLIDANGRPMTFDVKKWGRKIICTFTIDDATTNGIAAAYVNMVDDEKTMHNELLTFWVIK